MKNTANEKRKPAGKDLSRLSKAIHLEKKMGEKLGECQILFEKM